MPQPTLITRPLFQTSLRDWQASYKARQSGDTGERAGTVTTSRPARFAVRKRKKRD